MRYIVKQRIPNRVILNVLEALKSGWGECKEIRSDRTAISGDVGWEASLGYASVLGLGVAYRCLWG